MSRCPTFGLRMVQQVRHHRRRRTAELARATRAPRRFADPVGM